MVSRRMPTLAAEVGGQGRRGTIHRMHTHRLREAGGTDFRAPRWLSKTTQHMAKKSMRTGKKDAFFIRRTSIPQTTIC